VRDADGGLTPPDPPEAPGWDAALAAVRGVDGWMTTAQLRRLWEAAGAAPADATIVEIGSFHGRSAIVLALGAGTEARVWAIDPHAGSDRGPGEIRGALDTGERDRVTFRANLQAAAVDDRVEHVRRFSDMAHGDVSGAIDVLHIDGAHRYAPARDDIAGWGERVAPGGRMLIHDSFSSIGVTAAQLRLLVLSGRWRYLGRDGSLADYRREDLGGRARLGNAARQLAQLPWFARNVTVKVLLTLRLRRAARLLGADGWPY
jgi:predicted O-methyltransferase YrrM